MFSLKNLRKENNSVAALARRQVSSCWRRNTDIAFDKASLYEYTREWVNRMNRGGLIEVTNHFFLLISLIERKDRNILNINLLITYSGQCIRDQFCSKMKQQLTASKRMGPPREGSEQ